MKEKIQQLINESHKHTFDKNSYYNQSSGHGPYGRVGPEMNAWVAECEEIIKNNYGEQSSAWKIFNQFSNQGREGIDGNYYSNFEQQKNYIVGALTACLRLSPINKLNSQKNSDKDCSSVFIVHGHDEEAKIKVARFIEKIGLKSIILHEQANSGNTIIEKIEKNSNVGHGIVLYTSCDVGAKKSNKPDFQPRARQNVVFEHGYLMGKIGRKNVSALKKGDVETPSDISGIVYTPMDEEGAWQLQILKDLVNSGYNIDLNNLI